MSEIYVKSAEFVYTPDENEPLLKTLLLPLPQNRGTIFALIRILGATDEKKIRLKDAIEDHLKRLQNTLGDQVNVARRFEQVLQAINEDISRISYDGKRIPMTDFHAVIGVQEESQIFFSGVGSLFTLFMHKAAKQRYTLYELSDQYRSDDGPTWDKPFITVLDGELSYGDIFYLATRVSAREMSIVDLQDTLVTLPPSGALKRIQQHLFTDTPYGALCFHVEDRPSAGAPKKVNPLSSIEQFEKTQDDTASLLGEQTPDVSNLLNKVASPLLKKLSSPGSSGFKATVKNILRAIIKSIVIVATLIFKGILVVSKFVYKIVKVVVRAFLDPNKRKQIQGRTKNLVKKTLSFVKNTPKIAKIAAGAVLVSLIIVSFGLFLNAQQKEKRDTDQTFETIVSRINEDTDAASASLIYNNNNQARQLLEEALALLETLPPSHKKYEETSKELKTKIETIYSELRGVKTVDLTTLADLSSVSPGEAFTDLVSVDGVIYGVSQNQRLYRYSDLENQLIHENASFGAVGQIVSGSQYPGGFVFIDSNQRIGKANTINNTLNPVTSGAESIQSVEDITAYNGNLYLLSAAAQQIVKMQPQGDGFDAGTLWITSLNSNISNAQSLSVDGNIWLLTSNNLYKFSSGLEQNFVLATIDPPMQTAKSIWTSPESNYIYILDPAGSRIIVVDKEGNFITQYNNPDFQGAIDIFVNEEKKSIIVGTQTRLLQFTAAHLLQ